MRRRGDRALKEKAAAEEETKSAGRKAEQGEEGYQCTGLLEQDLPDLCARAGLTGVPRVTPRPPPSFPPDEEPPEPPLSKVLARIQHKYSCFQPRIQVELEHEDPHSVCAVFLRGWKLEENFLGVLSQCLPALAGLQAVHLWKVGLTERSLPALAALLAHCSRLRTLSLEGSPLPDAAFQTLMGGESKLAHLSLRNTGLGDAGAGVVGQSLGSSGRSLRSLVLSFNRISDLGAAHIAQGLRLNRSLLSLSLASNDIGDAGATKLAEVLGPFALTHAEIVERRRLLLAEALGWSHTASRERGGHSEHHSSAASAKHGKTPTRKKELLRKEEARQHKKRERGSEGLLVGHRGGCARSPVPGASEPRGARSRDAKTSGHEKSNPETTASRSGAWPPSWQRWRRSSRRSRRRQRGSKGCCVSPWSPALARLRELLPPQDPFPKPPGREEEQEGGA
ncbi:leucine-rich repeat-containing protein 71-like isoform 3-T3 [Chlamydotis macqueenii]